MTDIWVEILMLMGTFFISCLAYLAGYFRGRAAVAVQIDAVRDMRIGRIE